jgi:NAD(P)-dependent dehydrogenase (short-subunit alcohol dehydrogenase family)
MKIYDINSLVGRIFLVTGGSSGIGRATAKLLSECGAKVVIAGRNQERLNSTLDLLSGSGHQSFSSNFSNADEVFDWLKNVSEKVGPLDGVFHCAGVELVRPIRLTKQDHVNEVFSNSLFAAFGLARALSQKNSMKDGGSILFMSSVAGNSGQVGMAAYSAAKSAINGLVRPLACEFAPRKIRVNSIIAGAVNTAMHERLTAGGSGDAITKYEQMHLLGFGDVSEIANSAVFLLGPGSQWITGSSMLVDGGYMVR